MAGSDTTGAKRSGEAEARDSHVFVSYARDDRAKASRLISLLEDAGFKVWWDALLEGGEAFMPTIEAALETADCVIVLWSQTSVESNWVRDEAQSGVDRTCLVPVSLDGTLPPLGFRQFQMIDASHWNGNAHAPEAAQLLQAVSTRLGMPHPPAASQPRRMPEFAMNRRALATGGIALAGAAALAAWGLDLFPRQGSGRISLAVMPFANLSDDAGQVWFSQGLSNELRAALARNPRLKVSAPTSSLVSGQQAKDEFEVARLLGVSNILRGSVQLVGHDARITAELVQVDDGLVQWAESFDRQLEDILAVQSEIAQTVALSLLAEITGEAEARRSLLAQEAVGGTQNIVAYEAYLRGRAFYDLSSGQESDRAALAQFDAAIAADPQFAAAHAMRSTMLAALANTASQVSEVQRYYDQAIAAAENSIGLAPRLAQGHFALGFALNNGRLDRGAAATHFDQARKLASGDADVLRGIATFYAMGAATSEARSLIDEVLELDPLNARAFRSAGYIALLSRDYLQTQARMQQALTLNPQLSSALFAIGCAAFMEGKPRAALEQFRNEPVAIFKLTGEAITLHVIGQESEAQAAYQQLLADYGDAALYQQAQVQAHWGNHEQAIELLDRALAAFDPGMLLLPNDPLLDPLRSNPAFERLRARLLA